MQRQIITTKDNSKTLLIPEMNETYHSTNGALTEALHIFIKNGITEVAKNNKEINIFEMGFGTGLNAILTYQFAKQHLLKINYTCIEKFPITSEELKVLNYDELLNLNTKEQLVLEQMHQSSQKEILLSKSFKFYLMIEDLKRVDLNKANFDLIYFDAFAPSRQPDLWKKNVLQKMYNVLKPNGFLITYCAQGQFKRDLKSVGFTIKNLPGPPGKREITKAIKD